MMDFKSTPAKQTNQFNLSIVLIALISFAFSNLLVSSAHSAFSKDFSEGIRLESAQMGKDIIQQLKSSEVVSNTTTQRKEHKSVIASSILDEIFQNLGIAQGACRPVTLPDGQTLKFKSRDSKKRPGFLNGTFTIYGRAVVFQNDGNMNTKIRLRVRTYMDVAEDFSTIERSSEMKDWAFLEIKIKNPTPSEKGGSNKYRVKLHDKDILKLFRADPHSPQFATLIEELKSAALILNTDPVKDPLKIEQVFNVIQKLSQLRVKNVDAGREFIVPLLITSYVRESYSLIEKDYPVPREALPSRKPGLNFLKFWNFRKKSKIEYEKKDIEYQITVDRRVQAFLPEIATSDEVIETHRYPLLHSQGKEARYPEGAVSIEFKEPVEIAVLPLHFRSPRHQFLSVEMTQKINNNILLGYQVDRGKAGHLSRALNRIVERFKPQLQPE